MIKSKWFVGFFVVIIIIVSIYCIIIKRGDIMLLKDQYVILSGYKGIEIFDINKRIGRTVCTYDKGVKSTALSFAYASYGGGIICSMTPTDGPEEYRLVLMTLRNNKVEKRYISITGKSPFISPNGKHAIIWYKGLIKILNTENEKVEAIPKESVREYVAEPYYSWSPDSTKIVFTSSEDGNIKIFDLNSKNIKQLCKGDRPIWTKKADELSFEGEDGFYRYNIINNLKTKIFDYGTKTLSRGKRNGPLSWSNNNDNLLFSRPGDYFTYIYLYDFKNNKEYEIIGSPNDNYFWPENQKYMEKLFRVGISP
ncbi:MAG: hypothetical protein ABH873_04520 [Candidatus Firestonebacteria bacterium]